MPEHRDGTEVDRTALLQRRYLLQQHGTPSSILFLLQLLHKRRREPRRERPLELSILRGALAKDRDNEGAVVLRHRQRVGFPDDRGELLRELYRGEMWRPHNLAGVVREGSAL